MRFLLSLLPLLAVASAQFDYDNDFETEAGSRVGSAYRGSTMMNKEIGRELPMGVEAAIGLAALSKWDRSKISADRIGRYEVNPDFDLDGSRSLDLKMSPIVNFQHTNLIKGKFPTTMRMKQTKGKKIMLKLLKKGIKPITVKKFLWAKKQGLVNVGENPVRVMLAIQRESDLNDMNMNVGVGINSAVGEEYSNPIRSSFYDINTVEQPWTLRSPQYMYTDDNINQLTDNINFQNTYMQPNTVETNIPFTSSPSLSSSSVEHGVIIPNIQLAKQLQATGVVVTPTIMNQPAIEINHLKNQLLNCESVQWQTPSCTKLNELTVSLLGSSSVASRELLHDSIVNLQNKLSLQDLDMQRAIDLDKMF